MTTKKKQPKKRYKVESIEELTSKLDTQMLASEVDVIAERIAMALGAAITSPDEEDKEDMILAALANVTDLRNLLYDSTDPR